MKPEELVQLDPNAAPVRSGEGDIFSQPISPDEMYVLGWVDGMTTVGEILEASAVMPGDTLAALAHLADLGLILIPGYAPRTPNRKRKVSAPRVDKRPSRIVTPLEDNPADARIPTVPVPGFDEATIREVADLDHEDRLFVLTLASKVGEVDHYTFLGLARSAGHNEISTAAGRVMRWVDERLARSSLGSFKERLEQIREELEEARSVLLDPASRSFYDSTLEKPEE